MKEYTQSNLLPGNCWQTAAACLLEVDPDELPDQLSVSATGEHYGNALTNYLARHFDLMTYVMYDVGLFEVFTLREPGWHLISGPTVRTPHNQSNHVVVGCHGEQYWDPHPSRALLTAVTTFTLFMPVSELRRTARKAQAERLPGSLDCVCPKCLKQSTIPAPPSEPRCLQHPAAHTMKARAPGGAAEQRYLCLVCATDLGAAPPREPDDWQLDTDPSIEL